MPSLSSIDISPDSPVDDLSSSKESEASSISQSNSNDYDDDDDDNKDDNKKDNDKDNDNDKDIALAPESMILDDLSNLDDLNYEEEIASDVSPESTTSDEN